MGKSEKKRIVGNFKYIINIILIAVIGVLSVVFSALYVDAFEIGFIFENSKIINSLILAIVSTLCVLTIIFFAKNKEFVYKLFLLTIFLILILSLSLYILKISGFFEKIKTVEQFRQYISSFGAYAIVLFIVIQFLQVAVLPIPGFITIGAGVLLFGPLMGAIYSCIGIIVGSIVGFLIGRIFGYKVAKWLVGKENLDKWLKYIKGKDKIILTFAFLFPFFPDDVLCFVAGITTISTPFFIIMVFITRIISIFATCFSFNNSIIPYDTWWGILLWIAFFTISILTAIYIYKHGDKIEKIFKRKRLGKTKRKHI